MNADSWVHTTAVATAVGISGCRRHPPSKGGLDFTLDVLEVPEGTSFYKALKIPPSGLFPQDDVLNTFAVSTNWNSSLEVAQAYADSLSGGRVRGPQTAEVDRSRRRHPRLRPGRP